MSDMLRELLRVGGYHVDVATGSSEALTSVLSHEPDLVLLDVVLGYEDGRELFSQLRLLSDVPVIFLSGRGLPTDRVAGLDMGADDYIVKPFYPGELLARVGSVLRRSAEPHAPAMKGQEWLCYGDLRINRLSRETYCRGECIDLTAKEFDLLVFLASSPRQVFSRQQLLEQVWASNADWQGDATVTEHIHRLRRKIEIEPDLPHRIVTVRGAGYRFEPGGKRREEPETFSQRGA